MINVCLLCVFAHVRSCVLCDMADTSELPPLQVIDLKSASIITNQCWQTADEFTFKRRSPGKAARFPSLRIAGSRVRSRHNRAGLGLFAKERIRKGTKICDYGGRVRHYRTCEVLRATNEHRCASVLCCPCSLSSSLPPSPPPSPPLSPPSSAPPCACVSACDAVTLPDNVFVRALSLPQVVPLPWLPAKCSGWKD